MVDVKELKVYSEGLKILYVEDDDNLRVKTTQLLSHLFENVVTAENGQDGLDKYNEDKYDIVITDINMPIMNGIDMIDNIKKINETQTIIVTSAHDESEYLLKLIKLGIENFILKPIELDAMLSVIYKISKRIYNDKKVKEQEALLIKQSKLAAMGDMAGMIAHQWRQPLTSVSLRLYNIKLFAEIGQVDVDELAKNVEECNTIIDNLSTTIDNFRNFFKPKDEKARYSLKQCIHQTIDMIEKELEEHQVVVNTDLDDIVTLGYSNEFGQVLLNLINNAKDEFISREIKEPLIKIELKELNERAVIKVTDNAGGIPNNILDKIFEPYFSTKSKNKAGIGLYMSKNIIETHMNGTIVAENAYDGDIESGASFIIDFPVEK
jgi:YesN/AraC family two-component response regulator